MVVRCGAVAVMKRARRRVRRGGLRTRALHWVGSLNPPAHYRGKYAECTQMRALPPPDTRRRRCIARIHTPISLTPSHYPLHPVKTLN